MKQYTSPDQTAKLIELGFMPKARIKEVRAGHSRVEVIHDCHFTIGELIKVLPTIIDIDNGYDLSIYYNQAEWGICYDGNGLYYPLYSTKKDELIDALYDMIVKLKGEEVI